MIEIKMSGICEGCTMADLELDLLTMETMDDSCMEKSWSIRCEHQPVCTRWTMAMGAMRKKAKET